MDKYTEALSIMPNDFLHIASSFAIENSSPKIEPAHLLRALLHRNIGLIDYIETTLDSDYYYILDWADIRIGQCQKSPYPMKDSALSDMSKSAVKESLRIAKSQGDEVIKPEVLLMALVSPGVGFTADQLKTLPLSANNISIHLGGSKNNTMLAKGDETGSNRLARNQVNEFCENVLDTVPSAEIIGFEKEIKSMSETLSRKDRV